MGPDPNVLPFLLEIMQQLTCELLARAGYIARGVVYTIVGSFAVVAALSSGGGCSARRERYSPYFSSRMLLVVALGLLCFAAWRIAQAALDVGHLGTDWKPMASRIGFGVGAAANLALALSALALVFGMTSASGDGGNSAKDWTAYLLTAPFGQWVVGALGLIIVGIGIGVGVKGWKGTFAERLALDHNARRWVIPLDGSGSWRVVSCSWSSADFWCSPRCMRMPVTPRGRQGLCGN